MLITHETINAHVSDNMAASNAPSAV